MDGQSHLPPDRVPQHRAEFAVGPAGRVAVVRLHDARGCGRVGEGKQQAGKVGGVEQGEATGGGKQDEPARCHPEHLEQFAVAGAIDRGRADDDGGQR